MGVRKYRKHATTLGVALVLVLVSLLMVSVGAQARTSTTPDSSASWVGCLPPTATPVPPTATPTLVATVAGVEVTPVAQVAPAELPQMGGGSGMPGMLLAALALIALGTGAGALALVRQRK